jgi:hypothetical protein
MELHGGGHWLLLRYGGGLGDKFPVACVPRVPPWGGGWIWGPRALSRCSPDPIGPHQPWLATSKARALNAEQGRTRSLWARHTTVNSIIIKQASTHALRVCVTLTRSGPHAPCPTVIAPPLPACGVWTPGAAPSTITTTTRTKQNADALTRVRVRVRVQAAARPTTRTTCHVTASLNAPLS